VIGVLRDSRSTPIADSADYTAFTAPGSIAPGMLADFAVLDRDPRTCPPNELAEIPVAMTWIGGELLHEQP